MAPERRNQLVLAALTVVLAVTGYRAYQSWLPPTVSGTTVFNTAAGAGGRRPAGALSRMAAPDVHLGALSAERPRPVESDRNLFRFKPKPPPPPPAARPGAPAPQPPPPAAGAQTAASAGPPPPPPLPPIAFKFIGVVEAPQRGQKIAVLSDDRGVYHGREGDTIEGRYRILKIGAESIEMSYLDGRGQQTIRLSGS